MSYVIYQLEPRIEQVVGEFIKKECSESVELRLIRNGCCVMKLSTRWWGLLLLTEWFPHSAA